jgi:L-alanine-DL-glutamate epimerase-like enolase superfamily enzyme
MLEMKIECIDRAYASALRISYYSKTQSHTVVVALSDGDLVGLGEGIGVFYKGEDAASIVAQLEAVRDELTAGLSRPELQELLPAGGARNAVDCALWDLESKRSGRRAWELANTAVRPIVSDLTLSLGTPESMAAAALAAPKMSRFKLKLGGEGDIERVSAVRAARPDAGFIVDANQGWNAQQLHSFIPELAKLGVELVEQPLPAGEDAALAGFDSPIPICADESCQTTADLPELVDKYSYINIKLDKTGGLTEALRLADAAEAAGFRLMVGCMGGSSLSMAPGFIIGQRCDFIDLDGPLLTISDFPDAIRYDGGLMFPPEPRLWG